MDERMHELNEKMNGCMRWRNEMKDNNEWNAKNEIHDINGWNENKERPHTLNGRHECMGWRT